MPSKRSITVGMLVFDRMTQLDATGPFEVLANIPGATVLLVARRKRPVTAAGGLVLLPHTDLRSCPKLDILFIPGGTGINDLLLDDDVLAFVRRRARTARYVTSVCTGSLLLGAAGLLQGRRAGCHWLSLHMLAAFGARPSTRRVVQDGKFITAGGVTSGIDFGLTLAARLTSVRMAKGIQLLLQYEPQPPFRCGTPARAGKSLVARIVRVSRASQAARAVIVARAAARIAWI